MTFAERALAGDRRALSRLLTLVENQQPEGLEALRSLHAHAGKAHVLGVTGSPGSGKSTLVNQIALEARQRGRQVGIVAVDPSSPISGGAVLGDRVRMQALWNDPGVFVRSMAARDALGGLAESTGDVVTVLDACGRDLIIVETVGVGQAEVDIVREAHTTIVVVVPGMGDEIQAMKAGLMEIADIFVVNKADRDGADAVVLQLSNMLSLGEALSDPPPILRTVATRAEGIVPLLDAADRHLARIRASGELARRGEESARERVLAIARDLLLARIGPAVADELVAAVVDRRLDPRTAAERLVAGLTA